MPLPKKILEVDYARLGEARTIPLKLERWLGDQGYIIRLMSKHDQMADMMAPQGCVPLRLEDISPDDKSLRKDLLVDLRDNFFVEQPDGTFTRGDIRIYVQGAAARQAAWDAIVAEQKRMSEYDPEEVAEAMNEHINKSSEAAGHASVHVEAGGHFTTHASGGRRELARHLELGQLENNK